MLTPLKNRVLIKRDEAPKEIGGIIVPDAAQKPETFGEIVAIGSTADESLKIGQRVIFGKVDGTPIANKYVGQDGDYILMEDKQIKGIVENA